MTCIDCPNPISRQSKTGRCRPCSFKVLQANPEAQAKSLAALAARNACPEARKLMVAGSKIAGAKRKADPVTRAKLVENGKIYGKRNFTKAHTAEANAKRAISVRATHLAWCPEEYWPLNRALRDNKLGLAERKAMIADEIKRAEAKRLAGMTQLERQLEKIRNGATVHERFVPSVRHDYSLTGGSLQGL